MRIFPSPSGVSHGQLTVSTLSRIGLKVHLSLLYNMLINKDLTWTMTPRSLLSPKPECFPVRGCYLAVRKLKKSHQNVTGRFYSTLLNRLVQFDSLLERDFILLLDMHPVVRWFAEQPMKIRLGDESTGQFYVPDFLVTFQGDHFLGRRAIRPWIVETKYCSDLRANWSKLRPKFRAGVHEASKRDSQFRIVTESRLSTIDLTNARYLRRYLNADVPPEEIESVVRAVHAARRTTIGDLLLEVTDPAICVAIARRLIAAEFDKPFGPQTQVWER